MDAEVYIGKGMGPLGAAERIRRTGTAAGVYLILEPYPDTGSVPS